jgi:hypothetical protein
VANGDEKVHGQPLASHRRSDCQPYISYVSSEYQRLGSTGWIFYERLRFRSRSARRRLERMITNCTNLQSQRMIIKQSIHKDNDNEVYPILNRSVKQQNVCTVHTISELEIRLVLSPYHLVTLQRSLYSRCQCQSDMTPAVDLLDTCLPYAWSQ